MLRITPLILCLIISSATAFAQDLGSITGRITDSLDRPLEGAAVLLMNTAGATAKTALSDNKGSFHIEKLKLDKYKLVISMTGYMKDSSRTVSLD